jgi:hypothetical protein
MTWMSVHSHCLSLLNVNPKFILYICVILFYHCTSMCLASWWQSTLLSSRIWDGTANMPHTSFIYVIILNTQKYKKWHKNCKNVHVTFNDKKYHANFWEFNWSQVSNSIHKLLLNEFQLPYTPFLPLTHH